MKSGSEQDQRILRRFSASLRRHGPLGTAKRVNTAMGSYFCNVPGCRQLFLVIDKCLHNIQLHLDGSIDRKFGTDTSGYIPLNRLTIESKNAEEGIWYEPMSARVFAQIMNNLSINWGEFEFIDFGSGKGRVLLLASNYGFKKIIGVEFSKELHQVAVSNIALWYRHVRVRSNIQSICMDATEYVLPNAPLVIFFFSPFMGQTMARVIDSISESFSTNSRKIVIIFYGMNTETIDLLEKTNFHWRELDIRADWTKFNKYRSLVFTALPHSESNIDEIVAAPRSSRPMDARRELNDVILR